jgi:hypothetical protein
MALPAHMKLKGDLTLRETDRRWVFHPVHGNSIQFTHEGFQEACEVQAAIWQQFGGISDVERVRGPWWRVVTLWGWNVLGPLEESFVYTFEKITEWVEVDLRENPKALAAAGGAIDTLALWVEDIKAALKAKKRLPAYYTSIGQSATVDPNEELLYDIYARGVETYTQKRFVLRARRVIPINLGDRAAATATEVIYATSRLVSDYGIPSYIAETLPATPAANRTPPGCTWGWKLRDEDDVLYPSLAKREEVRTWVFAAWENLLYDFVS